uniref:Uncharacterized protein n=1 Tax=Panagrolaimus sp. JU765 TaxID=591449 RepID=A0AC34Q8V4_9BILA
MPTTTVTTGASTEAATKNVSADTTAGSQTPNKTVPSRKRSTTMSAGKKRRRKKAQKPPDFENWTEEYRKSYEAVSQLMREWKATQKQCEPIVTVLSRMKTFGKKNKNYGAELAAYEQAKTKMPVIGKDETFDWERA